MLKCDSVIKINSSMLAKLSQAQVKSLEDTAEALHTEILQAQVMPFDTGNLQGESTFVDYDSSKYGRVQIVSSTPYARRLYYHPEYNFQKGENPLAGGEWFKYWLPGGIYEDFAQNAFKKFLKRNGGL